MSAVSPSDMLRGIAAKGRRIQADIIAARDSKRGVNTTASLAVDAIDVLFDLSGRKRAATRLAKKYGHASTNSRIRALESEIDTWSSEAKNTLQNISVLQDGIPNKPNSDRLMRGFSKSMNLVRPENRLARGIAYLEELAESGLVYNGDLDGMRSATAAMDRSSKEASLTETGERLALLASNLEGFPSVQVAVRGALSAYEKKGDDWARQTLSSLRNALESLVKTLSGEGDWSKGLVKLMPSPSRRKPVRVAYDFVSIVGTHNEEVPDLHDVEYGVALAERAIRYVIEYSKPRPKTVKRVRTRQIELKSNATIIRRGDKESPGK